MIHVLMQAGGAGDKLDIISLISHAGAVPKAVLGLLALMSMISWYVIGAKWMYLSRSYRRSIRFVEKFWDSSLDEMWKEAQEQPPSPVSEVFRAGYLELIKLRKRNAQAQAGGKADEAERQRKHIAGRGSGSFRGQGGGDFHGWVKWAEATDS